MDINIDNELLSYENKIKNDIYSVIENLNINKELLNNLVRININKFKTGKEKSFYCKHEEEINIFVRDNIENLEELLIHEISYAIFKYQIINIKNNSFVKLYKNSITSSEDLESIDEVLAFYKQCNYIYDKKSIRDEEFFREFYNFLIKLIQNLRVNSSMYDFSQVIGILKFFIDKKIRLDFIGEKTQKYIDLLDIDFSSDEDLLNCYFYFKSNKDEIIKEILINNKKIIIN
ncbi:hypothetical protein VOH98_000871 [Clostridium perfringens]